LIYCEDNGACDADLLDKALGFYGSIADSMLTLYKCSSGGVDWEEPYSVLAASGNILLPALFLVFVVFWTFAVMNILGGIFLEKTLSNSNSDREEAMLLKRRKDQEDTDALKKLFASLDESGDGRLTKAEFQHCMQHADVISFLSFLGIDVKDAEMFFTLLVNTAEGDAIDSDDFIDNCIKLKGSASSIDVALISFDLKLLRKDISELRQFYLGKAVAKELTPAKGCTRAP